MYLQSLNLTCICSMSTFDMPIVFSSLQMMMSVAKKQTTAFNYVLTLKEVSIVDATLDFN